MTPEAVLTAGLADMNVEVTPAAKQQLLAYLALLQKWNKVYNLTAVRNPVDMVTLHLLDSISVLPYIKTGKILDVGSGGGLPGIVLAIMRRDLQVTTIDTVQKKAIFMRQVKGELGLANLEVVHARVEQYQPAEKFDAIISRAFSEIGLLMRLTQHLLVPHGHWLAMKGVVPHHEFEGLSIQPKEIIPLKVAGLQAERHLVVIESNA